MIWKQLIHFVPYFRKYSMCTAVHVVVHVLSLSKVRKYESTFESILQYHTSVLQYGSTIFSYVVHVLQYFRKYESIFEIVQLESTALHCTVRRLRTYVPSYEGTKVHSYTLHRLPSKVLSYLRRYTATHYTLHTYTVLSYESTFESTFVLSYEGTSQ